MFIHYLVHEPLTSLFAWFPRMATPNLPCFVYCPFTLGGGTHKKPSLYSTSLNYYVRYIIKIRRKTKPAISYNTVSHCFSPLHLLTSETHGQQQPIRQLELLEGGLVSEEVDLKMVETTFEHIHAHPLMLQRYYLTKKTVKRAITCTKSGRDFFGLLGGRELERLVSFRFSLAQTKERSQLCPVKMYIQYLSHILKAKE